MIRIRKIVNFLIPPLCGLQVKMNLETFNLLLIIDLTLVTLKNPSTFPIYELRNLIFLTQLEYVYTGKVRRRPEYFGEKKGRDLFFSP